MTTDRPYRARLPVEAAYEELRRNAGTQFDPDVVEAFVRLAPEALDSHPV
jgi:HD-GYP domain-containing protein (c-di-GMP phosphodiesterase class II)